MFMDPIGQLTVVSPQTDSVAHSAEAPRWFAALVRPQVVGRAVRVVAIDHASPVIIIGEPSDEIAEAWRDFSSLAIIWLTLSLIGAPCSSKHVAFLGYAAAHP
jgi:two-component system, NarL family, sensor histidine kinase UhpB